MMTAPAAPFAARKLDLKRRSCLVSQSGRRVTAKKSQSSGKCVGYSSVECSKKAHIFGSVVAQLSSGADLTRGIADDSIRYQRFKRRAGILIVFIVDVSGSMLAKRRMEAAKGCALSLLKDAYIGRDRVALVTFGAGGARLALPPTASAELASGLLKNVKTGGRTPMTEALDRAAALLEREKNTPVLFVLVTDGQYSRTNGDEETRIVRFGELCHRNNADILVVDAEEKSVFSLGMAQKVASLLGADLKNIDDMRADTLRAAVKGSQSTGNMG